MAISGLKRLCNAGELECERNVTWMPRQDMNFSPSPVIASFSMSECDDASSLTSPAHIRHICRISGSPRGSIVCRRTAKRSNCNRRHFERLSAEYTDLRNTQQKNSAMARLCLCASCQTKKIFKQAYFCDSCNTFSLADRDCQVVVGSAAWATVRYTELF